LRYVLQIRLTRMEIQTFQSH